MINIAGFYCVRCSLEKLRNCYDAIVERTSVFIHLRILDVSQYNIPIGWTKYRCSYLDCTIKADVGLCEQLVASMWEGESKRRGVYL